MKKTITVNLKERSYPIVVKEGAVTLLPSYIKKLSLSTDLVFITNALVKKYCFSGIVSVLKKSNISYKIFEVEDTEKSKSVETAFDLVRKVAQYGADKKIVIVALGGGVIGDLAGFVASIYKRGVPLIQIPTTLLAQIDSSIGGKVAIDLPEGKNLAGSFYQPKLVLIDTHFLKTLSDRQMKNGLAEMIKYGAIKDDGLFKFIEKNLEKILKRDLSVLSHLVYCCASIKAGVVSRDEKETKQERVLLNFGHTIGHAIEVVAGYEKYQHGEAVALGMRAAMKIAYDMKLIAQESVTRMEALLTSAGLCQTLKGISISKIQQAMKFDKKFLGRKNRFVLLKAIGKSFVKENIPTENILLSLKYISSF